LQVCRFSVAIKLDRSVSSYKEDGGVTLHVETGRERLVLSAVHVRDRKPLSSEAVCSLLVLWHQGPAVAAPRSGEADHEGGVVGDELIVTFLGELMDGAFLSRKAPS
jgi:hypothetical protein